jgi:hypothetical protein
MKTLKELIMGILSIYSIKRFLCLFFLCAVGISFIGSSFISCAPGIDELASSGGDNSGDDDRGSRDDEDDEDDDDEGDRCKGDEVCERICEEIYAVFAERIECMEKGDVKVAKLEKVHDLLMEDFNNADELENNLDEISEGDDVDRDDFGDYLEIGGTKWKEAIEDGLSGSNDTEKAARLVTTLKWLVEDENERAAKVLSSVDDGSAILKALLLALADNSNAGNNCIKDASPDVSATKNVDTNLWDLDISTYTVEIRHNKTSTGSNAVIGTVKLRNTAGAKLYNALSCKYDTINSDNVFFYSADQLNSTLFELAFGLLVDADVCGVNNPQYGEDKACAKALICWTAWQGAGGGTNSPTGAGSDFWDLVEERRSDLEYNGVRYNECQATDFADLFTND